MPRVVRPSSSPSTAPSPKPRVRRKKSEPPQEPTPKGAEARSSAAVEMLSAKASSGSTPSPSTPSLEVGEEGKKNALIPLHEGALQSWATGMGLPGLYRAPNEATWATCNASDSRRLPESATGRMIACPLPRVSLNPLARAGGRTLGTRRVLDAIGDPTRTRRREQTSQMLPSPETRERAPSAEPSACDAGAPSLWSRRGRRPVGAARRCSSNSSSCSR